MVLVLQLHSRKQLSWGKKKKKQTNNSNKTLSILWRSWQASVGKFLWHTVEFSSKLRHLNFVSTYLSAHFSQWSPHKVSYEQASTAEVFLVTLKSSLKGWGPSVKTHAGSVNVRYVFGTYLDSCMLHLRNCTNDKLLCSHCCCYPNIPYCFMWAKQNKMSLAPH